MRKDPYKRNDLPLYEDDQKETQTVRLSDIENDLKTITWSSFRFGLRQSIVIFSVL